MLLNKREYMIKASILIITRTLCNLFDFYYIDRLSKYSVTFKNSFLRFTLYKQIMK